MGTLANSLKLFKFISLDLTQDDWEDSCVFVRVGSLAGGEYTMDCGLGE